MIKQSLQKIDKLIRERKYPLPQIMLKLHTFLLYFAKRIIHQGEQYAALNLYGDAVKLFRNFLVEQPFKLTRITVAAIVDSLQANSQEHLQEIYGLRNRFMKDLSAYIPSDPFGRKAVAEMMDLKWARKMVSSLVIAQDQRRSIEHKKGTNHVYSEMTVLIWFGELKGEYLLHVSILVERSLRILKQMLGLVQFIDQNSTGQLEDLCDHDRRCYITAFQCDQFLHKLRTPQTVTRLWQVTQQKSKKQHFLSESSMVLRLCSQEGAANQLIGVTGQKIIFSQGVQNDVKMPPAIMVGSATESDIVLKSKYISRKQLLIIEDRVSKKQHPQSSKYNFSIICLSQTNFTSLKYPIRTKAAIGVIFFGEGIKYQIIAYDRTAILSQSQSQQDQRTLSLLPSANGIPKTNIQEHKLTFLILSGDDKEKQISISSNHLAEIMELDNKHLLILKNQLHFDEMFYLKPGVKILAKTSNQILEGKTSRKIRLSNAMEIYLDQYTLIVQ